MTLRPCLSSVFLSLFLFFFIPGISEAAILYVDEDSVAVQDGKSWTTAFHNLQDALAVAVSSDEIRIAQGTYRPDESFGNPTGTGDRDISFVPVDGLILLGGYAGVGSADPNLRDPSVYTAVLSGDLDGNDAPVSNASNLLSDPNRLENAYHVIRLNNVSSNMILDGLTISGGIAEGADPNFNGGGIQMSFSAPTIKNCRFEYNAAWYGGGVYNLTSSPTLTNCIFFRNYAQNAGGGLRNMASSGPVLSDCVFLENKAVGFGGAMANSNFSSPTVSQSNFSYNWANQGGAINNYEFCSPLISGSVFRYNSSDSYGGALSNQYESDAELINCGLFSNASPSGAAFYNYLSNPTIINCVASGNIALESGGVLYNSETTDVSIINCTFVSNTASVHGAALYNVLSNSSLQNCIVWNNVDSDTSPIFTESGSATVNYSCIQGGWIGGTGNIETDPMFFDPNGPDGFIGTMDDHFVLRPESLCIDAGDNHALPEDTADVDEDGIVMERIPLDYRSKDRFINLFEMNDTGLADLPLYPDIIDMGANERARPILVDLLSPGPVHDGTVWEKAFTHPQDALDIAEAGDQILVAQGLYCPDPNKTDPAVTFELKNGIALMGGYAGWSEPDPNERDIESYLTVLSGDLLDNDSDVTDAKQMANDPNRADNSYHILTAENVGHLTELSGFTITGGMAIGVSPNHAGGGIKIGFSNLTIRNCLFEYNMAEYGAAVYNLTSSPIVSDCRFFRNYALYHGGSIRNYSESNPELSYCSFTENKASGYGGAMANSDFSSPIVQQSEFSYNWAGQGGAAINNYDFCILRIIQSVFEYNITENNGGALRNENNSDIELIKCDFISNTAALGGAIYNTSSAPVVNDCNFINNSATENGGAVYSTNSPLSIQTSSFTMNQSDHYGGALYDIASSPLDITDCVFTSNTSSCGGAVFCESSASTIYTSTFLNNTTTDSNSVIEASGGAVYNALEEMMISQSDFQNNESFANGGAIYNINGNLSMEECIFRNNQSGQKGGAIFTLTADTVNIWKCILSSNTAGLDGGGLFTENVSQGELINCLITYNNADTGGGIANTGSSMAEMIHCTLTENSAGTGEGIYSSESSIVIQNSIVLDSIVPDSSAAVDYSCIPNWTGPGVGNITSENPQFVNPLGLDEVPGTDDDDFRLSSDSPCRDAADNGAIPAGLETDLDGRDRLIDSNCSGLAVADMGVYEFTTLSMGDFNLSCSIDLIDFMGLANAWMTTEGQTPYNSDYDMSVPPDHVIDGQDLIVFCENWLAGIE